MKKFSLLMSFAVALSTLAIAQSHTCPSMFSRNNGNGQASSCPGVSGTLVASNVAGTSYATVPTGSKTADIIFEFANTDPWKSAPPVITATHQTVNGTSVAINTFPGPPGVPAIQTNGRGQILYCSYAGSTGNGNMPNSNVVSFLFVTPGTTNQLRCSYNFSSANSTVSNPVALPIQFYSFQAQQTSKGTRLHWTTTVDAMASHFEIQRSQDGSSYAPIGTILADHGTGKGIAEYSFADGMEDLNVAGNVYYRIKQIDNDGVFIYSDTKVVHATADAATGLDIAIHGTEVVVKSSVPQEAELQSFNTSGQLLASQHTTLNVGMNRLGAIHPNAGIVRVVTSNGVAVTRY
jgi:hypothetical protein